MTTALAERLDRVEDQTFTLESVLGQFIVSTNTALLRLEREMSDFKDEVRTFKIEAERDRKRMNKQWGRLANKMGTLVEDIAAPNVRRAAAEDLGGGDLELFAVRVEKRHAVDRARQREFDVVAVTREMLVINETKSNPKPEYVNDFVELLQEIGEWFPEYSDRRLVPIFSSLYIPENVVTQLTRNGIYAMAMQDDNMVLLNMEQLRVSD